LNFLDPHQASMFETLSVTSSAFCLITPARPQLAAVSKLVADSEAMQICAAQRKSST
jgi:hypothetical protein